VQMRHGFAGVWTVVHNEPEPLREIELLGHLPCDEQQVAEDGLISRSRFADARYHFFGDDQEVNRGLGLDVVQDDAQVVFVFETSGNLARDDFLEKRGHRPSQTFCREELNRILNGCGRGSRAHSMAHSKKQQLQI
jgi:hypothetical protein